MARRRFQLGSLFQRGKHPKVWVALVGGNYQSRRFHRATEARGGARHRCQTITRLKSSQNDSTQLTVACIVPNRLAHFEFREED